MMLKDSNPWQLSNIRRSIVMSFSLVLLVILAIVVYAITYIHNYHLEHEVADRRESITSLFNTEVSESAVLMTTLVDRVIHDTLIQEAWANQDRAQLYAVTKDLFEHYRKLYNITHFYLIKPDLTCFLRVHTPERYGDKLDRVIIGRTAETGEVNHGIELGAYGTLTLRYATPWVVNDVLIGYIEMGEEVESIIRGFNKSIDIDIITTVDKYYLDRDNWKIGVEMMGHDWQWETLPYCVVVGNTGSSLPKELAEYTHPANTIASGEVFNITDGAQEFSCISVNFSDAMGRAIGDLYVLHQVSLQSNAYYLIITLLIISVVLLGGLLVGMVDHVLAAVRAKIHQGVLQQSELEQLRMTVKKIKKTKRRLVKAQQLARIGYWELDIKNRKIWAANEAFEMYGIVQKSPFVAVSRIIKAIHADDRERLFTILKRTIQDGERFSIDFRLTATPNQKERVIFAQAKLVCNFAGEPIKMEGFIQDITDTMKIEAQKHQLDEKLSRAERMNSIGLLAGGVAHDLNNMLGPIVGYPELLLRKMPKESPYRKQIQRIGNAAQQAAEVVKDLLTLARRGRYEMVPTNLNEMIHSYLDSPGYQRLREEHPNVELSLNLKEGLANLIGSSPHLHQVLMNLVINAYDAMPTGGKLTVTTKQMKLNKLRSGFNDIKKGDYIVLSVADTGMGIPPEALPRIFEPYYSKKKMGRSGSGLGLSVVYGIVKDHNGYYDVFSEVGKFTEFVLYLPYTKEPSVITVADTGDQGGNETILVVDDTPVQLEVAQALLSSLGYKVHTVPSGEAALDFVKHNAVDLVLLDVLLEDGIDGPETYRQMIGVKSDLKAIMVSGASVDDRLKQAEAIGVRASLKKPYTLRVLGKLVRKTLEEKNRQPVA